MSRPTSSASHRRPIESDHHDEPYIPPTSTASLRRLQVLHPLSLLLLIASFAITNVITHPSLKQVAKRHPTYFNPSDLWLMGYWGLLLLLQVGTALSVALAGSERTKSLLTNGMSISLPISNILLAAWAPVFILDQGPAFIAGEVLLGLSALMLLASVLVTGARVAFRPSWKRPGEWLLIHLPLRLFLAVLLQVDLWQQGLIAFGLAAGGPPNQSTIWPSFIIITSVGLASSFWIFATTDIAFGGASIYLQLAILFARRNGSVRVEDRPSELLAAHILSIVLMSVALLASLVWGRLIGGSPSEGRIALGRNPQDEAAAEQAEAEAIVAEQRAAARREEAERLRGGNGGGSATGEEPTPSQVEEGQVGVTRKLGQHD